MIGCVWFSTFAASLVRRDERVSRRRQILLYDSLSGKVLATSAEAAPAERGMSIIQAADLRPGSHLAPYAPERVEAAFEETLAMLRDFADRIESSRDGNVVCFYLDLGRLTQTSGERLGRKLRNRLKRGMKLTPTVGLARGKFTAALAASVIETVKAVTPSVELAWLAPHPVDRLPLEREALRRLDLFGIRTIGAFAKLPRVAVIAQFGREAATAHDLARGIDRRPVVPHIPTRRVTGAVDFDDPVTDRERLTAVICETGARLFTPEERAGYVVVGLEIALNDEVTLARSPSVSIPDTSTLIRQLRDALRDVTGQIDGFRLTLTCEQPPAPVQLALFPDEDGSAHDLQLMAGRIEARYGPESVYRVARVAPDAPIPERRVERVS